MQILCYTGVLATLVHINDITFQMGTTKYQSQSTINRVCDVMVSMVTSSMVDCGFLPQWGKIKD